MGESGLNVLGLILPRLGHRRAQLARADLECSEEDQHPKDGVRTPGSSVNRDHDAKERDEEEAARPVDEPLDEELVLLGLRLVLRASAKESSPVSLMGGKKVAERVK